MICFNVLPSTAVSLIENIPFGFLFHSAAFNLDFYTEVMDLHYLLDHLASDPFFKKFHQLNKKMAEVVEDYGLVSFVPLNVQVQPLSRYIMCTTLSFDSNTSSWIKLATKRVLHAILTATTWVLDSDQYLRHTCQGSCVILFWNPDIATFAENHNHKQSVHNVLVFILSDPLIHSII